MKGYLNYCIAAGVIAALVLLVGTQLGGSRGVAAAGTVFFVAMLDPIVLLVTIVAGIFVRPFPGAVAAGIVAGLGFQMLAGALNDRPPRSEFVILGVLAAVTLVLAAHAIARAVAEAQVAPTKE